MVCKLYRSGNSMAVFLPQEMLEAMHLREGAEVEVTFDPAQGRITITPVPVAGGAGADFARQVNEFIAHYRPALEALARA